jgi:hypothetical protein
MHQSYTMCTSTNLLFGIVSYTNIAAKRIVRWNAVGVTTRILLSLGHEILYYYKYSESGQLVSLFYCKTGIWHLHETDIRPWAGKTKFCIWVLTIPNPLQSWPLVTPHT